MHQQVLDFVGKVRDNFPHHFQKAKVVEVGSFNINGSVRPFFSECEYIGLDLQPGPTVEVVSRAHEWTPPWPADTVISTEALEHDEYWAQTLPSMVKFLRPHGLLVITCATEGRAEHGTRRSSPADSPMTLDWYRNLVEADFHSAWGGSPEEFFTSWAFETGSPADIRFWGVKK